MRIGVQQRVSDAPIRLVAKFKTVKRCHEFLSERDVDRHWQQQQSFVMPLGAGFVPQREEALVCSVIIHGFERLCEVRLETDWCSCELDPWDCFSCLWVGLSRCETALLGYAMEHLSVPPRPLAHDVQWSRVIRLAQQKPRVWHSSPRRGLCGGKLLRHELDH